MAFSPEPVTMTSMRDLFKEQLDPVIRDMATIKESIDTINMLQAKVSELEEHKTTLTKELDTVKKNVGF